MGEVKTLLVVDGYDEQRAHQALEFLREYCGPESTGLVTIEGGCIALLILACACCSHMSYTGRRAYIIDRDYRGVKYAKDKQVARCGNAVPPPFAEVLVRANLPELCQSKEIAA